MLASAPRDLPRQRSVGTDGADVFCLEKGRGEPVVVLHGLGGLYWGGFHDLLAQGHRVLAMEVPATTAAWGTRGWSSNQQAQALASVCAELELARYNLIAMSFAARVALLQALDAAERVRTLVLVSPWLLLPEGWHLPAHDSRSLARFLYAHPERRPVPWMRASVEAPGAALAEIEEFHKPGREPGIEERLQQLTAPTLVLFGTNDRITMPELARRYPPLVRDCHTIFVYDAAHEVASDRPEAAALIIGEFVDRRDAFVVEHRSGLLSP